MCAQGGALMLEQLGSLALALKGSTYAYVEGGTGRARVAPACCCTMARAALQPAAEAHSLRFVGSVSARLLDAKTHQ